MWLIADVQFADPLGPQKHFPSHDCTSTPSMGVEKSIGLSPPFGLPPLCSIFGPSAQVGQSSTEAEAEAESIVLLQENQATTVSQFEKFQQNHPLQEECAE